MKVWAIEVWAEWKNKERKVWGGKGAAVGDGPRAISSSYIVIWSSWALRFNAKYSKRGSERERGEKNGDLCARGHRGINFLTKLSPTIKPKSMPKSPKRDLKNNIFARQHSHPFNILSTTKDSQFRSSDERKIECLRIFIWAFVEWDKFLSFFFLPLLTYIYSRIIHRMISIQTASLVETKHQITHSFSLSQTFFVLFVPPPAPSLQ